ncbi:MAG: ATPase domain-containing protein [Pirellulales bacterium]
MSTVQDPASIKRGKQHLLADEFCNVERIHGFSSLFGRVLREPDVKQAAENDDSNDQSKCEGQIGTDPRQVAKSIERRTGLRFGSTLLISGPPGAGKTTFALATIRAMMAEAHRRSRNQDNPHKAIAYYISSEVHEEQLSDSFEDFDWFRIRKPAAKDEFKFWIDNPEPDKTNFYTITALSEVDRPVPSPEELVNGIFNCIAHTLVPSEAPIENAKIYIIIDSITALLKGCGSPGEERRQTHEIKRRLQDRFSKENLALIVLLAEQDHRSQDVGSTTAPTTPTEPSVEDYLADVVFRLYVRNLPLGRRSRVLEVVKSQGAIMTLGEHTWQIVSEGNYLEVIRHGDFAEEIKRNCLEISPQSRELPRLADVSRWGGIVIFSRPRLYSRGEEPAQIADAGAVTQAAPLTSLKQKQVPELASGTEGLDLNLDPGSITLIAGPMGCGKTTLCEQFLRVNQGSRRRALISFDIPATPTKDAKEFSTAEAASKENFQSIHFTQSQFDLNVLVAHINWILDHPVGCDRLAFDGLSEWITTFEKPEAARVLEAIMVTVKRHRGKGAPPAVFMTYEMPLDDDPLGPAALGADADNLVVVRKVPINDELRTVIYVLKRDGGRQDEGKPSSLEYPGELKLGKDGLLINETSLEAFTGLLSPERKVEPARVLIQLFAENKNEKKFNDAVARRLRSQYKMRLRLTFTQFTLSEIGNTLETAYGAGKPGESFNLMIHSVDEWWLREEENREHLKDLKATKSSKGPHYGDFWWFEIEKAVKKDHSQWHAVPGYLDFGMFCINLSATAPGAIEESFGLSTTGNSSSVVIRRNKQWRKVLAAVPRRWVRPHKDNERWFQVRTGSEAEIDPADPTSQETVLEFALRVTGQQDTTNQERKPVFTFDSATRETCSCMFFELAWAFGASEPLLAKRDEAGPDFQAAVDAFAFLQFMVMEGLLPARSSAHSRNHVDEPILFSRQWYSTLQRNQKPLRKPQGNQRHGPAERRVNQLVALPFMPIGRQTNSSTDSLIIDLAIRQQRWLRRATRYVEINCNPSRRTDSGAWNELDRRWRDLNLKCAELAAADDSQTRVRLALEAYRASREWLLQAASVQGLESSANQAWGPDLDDLMEIAGWLAFRLRMLFGKSEGRFPAPASKVPPSPAMFDVDPVDVALFEARWIRHNLPTLDELEPANFDPANIVPAGYVCSGSWMFGVDRKSRSSEIQAQILSELTSLDSAEKREEGGGNVGPERFLLSQRP